MGGGTWLLELIRVNVWPASLALMAFCTTLNSLQGLFIFVFYVLLSREAVSSGLWRWMMVNTASSTTTSPPPVPLASTGARGEASWVIISTSLIIKVLTKMCANVTVTYVSTTWHGIFTWDIVRADKNKVELLHLCSYPIRPAQCRVHTVYIQKLLLDITLRCNSTQDC